MNKPLRLAWLIASILIFLIFTIITSCQKEESTNGLSPIGLSQGSLLGESKTFFQREVLTQAPMYNDGSLRHQVGKTPVWNKAVEVQTQFGRGLKVPLQYQDQVFIEIGSNKELVPLEELSYLFVYTDQNGLKHTEVVTRIPDEAYREHQNEPGRTFSGITIIEDWWGRPIKTFQTTALQQSYVLGNPVKLENPKKLAEQDNMAPKDDCVVICTIENGSYSVEMICRPANGGNSDGGHHEEPRENYDQHPHGGGGGGGHRNDNPPSSGNNDIENNVNNPCLKAVVSRLKNSNISGKIGEIISTLDTETNIQIKVFDAPEVYNNNGESIPAHFDPHPGFVNGNFSGAITISSNTLLPSTEENAAAVIIHEVVHAYLKYTNPLNTWDKPMQHTIISDKYVMPMAYYLASLYSIPIKDATALAWSGLDNSAIYTDLSSFDYPGGVMTKDELKSIYGNYVTKILGSPICE